MVTKQSTAGLVIAALGVALQAGLIVAALKIVYGLRYAVATLGTSGIGDPTSLAGAVGEVLEGSAAGLALGFLGLVLLCIALVGAHYRAGWFSWFLFFYGVLLLVAFPLGTGFGIFFLVYVRAHREEFITFSPLPPNS